MKLLIAPLLLLALSPALAAPTEPPEVDALLIGNSLIYVNNMPALFNALDARQPGQRRFRADVLAAPGGSIAERWQAGVAAAEIASGHWQVLVLQERGGLLACLGAPERRDEPECAASLRAHRNFAQLAKHHGMRVIVLGTWGPDSIWQGELSRGLRRLARSIDAEALDAGPPVRAYAKAHPKTAMYTDAILHPTLDTSLWMAVALYRQLAAQTPEALALDISAPLLTSRAAVIADRLLSMQPQLAGDSVITHIGTDRLQPLVEAVALDEAQLVHE